MESSSDQHPQNTHSLRFLLAQLFLHFIPSVFLGIVSLVLIEAARFINHVATLCQTPQPKPPIPSSQTTSPLTEPVPSSRNSHHPPTPPLLPTPPTLSLTPPSTTAHPHTLPPVPASPPAPSSPPLSHSSPSPQPAPPPPPPHSPSRTTTSPPPPPPSCSPPSPSSASPPPQSSYPSSIPSTPSPPPPSHAPPSPSATPPQPSSHPPRSPSATPPHSPSHLPRSPSAASPLPALPPLPPSSPSRGATSPPLSLPRSPFPPSPATTPLPSSPLHQPSSLHVSISSTAASPPPAPTPPPSYSPRHALLPTLATTPPLTPPPHHHHPTTVSSSSPDQRIHDSPVMSPPSPQQPNCPPPIPSSRKPPNPSTLVAKRVSAYENFIADTSAHLNQPIRLHFPTNGVNNPSQQTSSAPSVTSSAPSVTSSQTKSSASNVVPRLIVSDSESESESDSRNPLFLQPGGKSGDVQTFVAQTESSSGDTQISMEAPGGRESLQELIPEEMPQSYSTLALEHNDVTQTDDSIGKMSPLRLSRNGSITSLRTESYSSPDSQSHLSYKNRKSWRGSDHDLFSEEPIMTFESIDEFNANEGGSATSSSLGNDNFVVRKDQDISDKPVKSKNVRIRRSFSFEEDMRVAEAIPNIRRDASPANFDDTDFKESRKGGKNRRVIQDSKLFRQASIDLPSINTATFLTDRPRPGAAEPTRFIPNRFAGLRFSRTPSVDYAPSRATGFNNVGRSQSTAETHFDDWPEYTPSGEEDEDSPTLSRRHASDMSYGVKARREDMLPVELLDDPGAENNFLDGTESLFDRLGAKAWKRRFGRSSGKKEDAKAVMKSILRRKRKISALGSDAAIMGHSDLSHRGRERSNHLSGRERDYSFESELEQDTVYSLLDRICPECGFIVVVRRASHKVKIEVPGEGDKRAMLLSISLSRIANGRSTLVTVCRSKDDTSDGTTQAVESAGRLLQKRLAGQVEFIEDSFASLYFDESTVDIVDKASRIE